MNKIKKEMETIRDFFLPIMQSSGKAKEPFIKDCMQFAIPRIALCFLLNPAEVTHVGGKSFEKIKDVQVNKFYESVFDIIDDLKTLPAANDQIIANIHYAFHDLSDVKLFAYSFICKDISLGITAKTVNKVMGQEIIPEFRCMLANKYFEHPDKVEGKHFYLTEKLDGIRCIAKATPDKVQLFSRQGQLIWGLEDVERELLIASQRLRKSFVVDGELLVSDRESIPSKEQYKRTTMIVRKEGPKKDITYNVFDVLDYSAFENRQCEMPYYQRRQRLETYFPSSDYDYLKVLPILYHGSDTGKIIEYLNVQRSLEHEGVMINLADETYQFSRTNALLKVKVMQDCDLEIIGFEAGRGKFEGTLGALVCNYKGTPVGVGSGLSDENRRMFWDHQDEYLGRVVTIQYFEETNDANGKLSIRFPVFKELREEGKEVSYS